MKAIVFDKIGPPSDVLRLANVPVPEVAEGEVLVKMIAASINPGDFLFIQNLYPDPKKPHFPGQIAGNHGAGIITKIGKNVSLKPGTLVAFSYYNTWAEYAAVPAKWLIPLPADYPIEKAAQFVNLITSRDLLDASRVQPGQWLALTAGNSTTATMVLQFAALRNVKVISMVRRAQNRIDLEAWGASEVIELASLAQSVGDRIMEITQGQGVNGVVDCVGGPVAGELIRSLSVGGQFVIYGGFSSEKFELHNFDILMRGSAIKSYIYRYFFTPPQTEDAKLLREIAEISGQTELRVSVGGLRPLEEFKTAIYETEKHSERGKRFFGMRSD